MDRNKTEQWFGDDEWAALANDCDIIIDDDINSIHEINLYKEPVAFLNDKIVERMKAILRRSKKKKTL